MSAETPTSPASQIWPATPEALLPELLSQITAGIRAAFDTILHILPSHPDSPSPITLQTLLQTLSIRLQPLLQTELQKLSFILHRAIFTLPPSLPPFHQTHLLQQHQHQQAQIDAKIAIVRAALRDAHTQKRHLHLVTESARAQVAVLRRVVEAGKRDNCELKKIGRDVAQAENDFVKCVRVLDTAQQTGCDMLKRVARGNDDEHGPLQSFLPCAGDVLAAQGEGGPEGLAALRERLLG